MPLNINQPIGFIPTTDGDAARTFYETILGLNFETDDGFALVFRVGRDHGTMLRVVRVGSFTPLPFTVFGWESEAIETTIDELAEKGVDFLRFSLFEQDERGVWQAPGGAKVAWFKDPDGNTLSISQHG